MRISYWSSDVFSSDLGCLRFANHFVGIDPVVIDLAFGEWLHRHVVGEQPFLLCRAHVQRQGRPGADVSGALERGVLTGRADEPRQVPALAFGPANRSEEHTSELQSLMRNSYAVFCLKKQIQHLSTTS